jgi:mannose-6-phosphate isomerase-like protein (cupin superfamily)
MIFHLAVHQIICERPSRHTISQPTLFRAHANGIVIRAYKASNLTGTNPYIKKIFYLGLRLRENKNGSRPWRLQELMTGIERFPEFVTALPEVELPFAGARGWLLQGTDQQTVFIEFSETVNVPEHEHAEQWEFALAGRVELHRQGISREYTTGENFFIPAGSPHSARVYAGYKALIVFNAPDRYKPKE